jgi:hypothetical protein
MWSWRTKGRVVAAAAASVLWASAAFPQETLKFNDPSDRFTVEFPRNWNWQIVAGAVEPIVTFVQPGGQAYVIIEHIHMNLPLTAEEVTDTFAQGEAANLKDNQPKASDVDAKMMMQGNRRFVVINYRRPGLAEPERVRQYSYPLGRDLYRITCAAVATQFARGEPVFTALSESFKPAMRATR